ncbi:phage resistance protein [Fusobacterium sp. HMSC064B11]|uniref:type III toxin-antitoxin system ToxN/AbiQ family toxin n=1 Tax=Fusobacterium TaxID=848 RepID=UPI0008A6112B|nr:type III toxin-antitoxin system ToxN/AbiQ family toxin [Fusobacterium sp. HMSC064B11]OFO31008.1 phage resistance protein [Fusobacterium sp. HMSC064B11]
MSKRLKFYNIDLEYIENLQKIDNKIPDTSKENKKENRKFIGILLKINGVNYVAPLSSPKEKHLSMKDGIDFIKIDNGTLGIINFNNMFPVPNHLMTEIDISKENDPQYKILLTKQLTWCNEVKNKKKILKTSKLLYNLIRIGIISEKVKGRCCNFELLEEKSFEYIKDNQYNCLTGNQINIELHSSGENRWIAKKDVEKYGIEKKDNSKEIFANIYLKMSEKELREYIKNKENEKEVNLSDEEKLYQIPITYYNISDLKITKEIEQKFISMKEKEKIQEILKAKDQEIGG